MKRKQDKLFFFFLMVVTIFQLTVATIVDAETTTIDELVPNDYQKNQFKFNKDLLHDSSSTTNKVNIPEEQKDLTFKGEKTSRDAALKEDLFLSAATDQNTIKTKAENLQLFTSTESSTRKQVEEDLSSSSTLSLTTFIWILVGICFFLLLIVLVVWGNSIMKQRTPRNT